MDTTGYPRAQPTDTASNSSNVGAIVGLSLAQLTVFGVFMFLCYKIYNYKNNYADNIIKSTKDKNKNKPLLYGLNFVVFLALTIVISYYLYKNIQK